MASAVARGYEEANCIVCGDVFKKVHFQHLTCEGCKMFFRRTVDHLLKYKCDFDGNCANNDNRRTDCHYCQFMKCITNGMDVTSKNRLKQYLAEIQTEEGNDLEETSPPKRARIEPTKEY